MSDPTLFALAVLALLATPGPTNTLLAAAGAARGIAAALPLLLFEGGGYLLAILALHWLIAPAIAVWPAVGNALKVALAVWLLWTAVRLWRLAGAGAPGPARRSGRAAIAGRHVFVTTLLNPKAVVLATVVIPFDQAGRPATLAYLAAFSVLAGATGTLWIALGAWFGQVSSAGAASGPWLALRVGALVLGGFALMLAAASLASPA